jgi:alanine racemase
MTGRRPTWVEVDLDALAGNLRSIRSRVGASRRIIAVVKADAYGHGAVPVARRLESEGADMFGVAMAEEGIELRKGGIEKPILILGPFTPSQIPALVDSDLTPTVYSMATLSAILDAERRLDRRIPFHLKVETGMGRLGLLPHDLRAALDRLAALPHPSLEGVLTTLAGSDQDDNPQIASQIRAFTAALEEIRRRGLSPQCVHIANSGGVLKYPDAWFSMVRPGLALYGLRPSGDPSEPDFRPVLSFRTRIIMLKTVPPETPIGYGGQFRTLRESRIATIAAGYDDGVNRLLHDGGEVLVRGRRAPYAGRISMDFSMVDVTDVAGAEEGDEVTIIGRQDDAAVTAWDLARVCRTIPYEILCRIGPRVPRVYVSEGTARSIRSRFDGPATVSPAKG